MFCGSCYSGNFDAGNCWSTGKHLVSVSVCYHLTQLSKEEKMLVCCLLQLVTLISASHPAAFLPKYNHLAQVKTASVEQMRSESGK